MPEFYSSKIIFHRFYVDKNEGELEIGYEMIIGHELMVQLGLSDGFKRQVLEWDDATVTMKEPSGLIGQTYLTSYDMREVVMQKEDPVSTREVSERMVENLESNYAKTDLEQLSTNTTNIIAEDRTRLLGLLKDLRNILMEL